MAGFTRSGAGLPLVFKKVDQLPAAKKRPQEPKPPFPYKKKNVTYSNAAAGKGLHADTSAVQRTVSGPRR